MKILCFILFNYCNISRPREMKKTAFYGTNWSDKKLAAQKDIDTAKSTFVNGTIVKLFRWPDVYIVTGKMFVGTIFLKELIIN